MLTRDNLDTIDNQSGESGDRNKAFELNMREQLRKRALQIYRDELNKPYSQDLGLHGTSRAALRVLCKETVLESSIQMRKKYSYSQTSSAHSSVIDNEDNAISKLKLLQKERLIVSRMGFAERAMELDREIDLMRVEAKKAREAEENTILFQRLKALALSHSRKEQRFEFILQEETRKMEEQFAKEEQEVGERQEKEFLRVLESASRRAVGRAKRCACQMPYLCRHNKSASYNTRRPVHTVIVYRRNAKRLKRAGRPEESEMWEEKAKEIDEKEQEKWRNKVANSIVASPWGANEAAVDQVTEWHKKELQVLRKTHAVKRDMHQKRQAMRRRNFKNTILAEERKVRIQCRKQAHLRVHKDYVAEKREQARQARLSGRSDGLLNVSRNLLGDDNGLDTGDEPVDWAPPISFGLDNSVRLIDAVNEATGGGYSASFSADHSGGRILTSKTDIKSMDAKQIQEKIHSSLMKDDNSENDSEESSEKEESEEEEETSYKLGSTSGSKLVDRLRKLKRKGEEREAKNNSMNSLSNKADTASNHTINNNGMGNVQPSPGSSSATFTGGWMGGNTASAFPPSSFGQGTNNSFSGFGMASPAPNNFGGSGTGFPFAAPPASPAPSVPSFRTGQNLSAVGAFPATVGVPGTTTNSVIGTNSGSWLNNPSTNEAWKSPGLSMEQSLAFSPLKISNSNNVSSSNFGGNNLSVQLGNNMSSGMTGASQSSKPLSPRLRSPPPSIVIQQIDDDDEDGLDLDLNNNTATNKIITSPTHREQELAMTLDDQDNSSEDEAIPKCSKGPLPIDWVLEPRDLIPPSFQPGSLNDEDWKDHDEALGNGIENSYGIVIASAGQASRDRVAVIDKALKKSAVQGIVDERIVTPVRRSSFGAGHEPPTPGSSESVPQKGILVSKSRYKGLSTKGGLTYSTKSNASVASEKRIQFGEDKVQVFSIVDDENANDNDHHQPNEHHNNQSSQLLSTAPINNNSLSSNSGTNNFSSLVGQPSNTMLMYSSDGASNNNPFGNPFNTMNSFANASSASTQGSAAVSNSSLSTETVHAFNNLSGSTGVQPSPGFQLNSNATMGLASNIMGSTVPNAFSGSSVPAWGMGLSNTFGAGIGSMDSSLKNISSRPTDAVASPFNNTPPFKKQPLLDNDQGLTDLARPVSPRASTADNNFPAFSMSPSFVQPIPPSDKPVSLRPQVGSTNNFINSSSAFDLSGLSNTLVYNNGEDGHSTPKKSESPTNLSTMPRYYPKNSDLIPIDISAEVESEIDASSTGSAGKTNTGPNWQLCFYRFKCLDDVEKFLEAVLVEDELFEVFDLYSSTKPDGEDTVLKMQLLRGWKKFQADSSGVEELLAGFTDVLNINEVDEQEIPDILEEHQMELETLFNELAYHCMPDFIASNSFGTYFDTQAALKANNKILRIDSKSWIGKFQKAVKNLRHGFHLFPFAGGRPYANTHMRELFGPMCDTPSPKEYLDPSTGPDKISQIERAMKDPSTDILLEVNCRTIQRKINKTLLCLKHLWSQKRENRVLYSIVIVSDSSKNTEKMKRIVDSMMECIPAALIADTTQNGTTLNNGDAFDGSSSVRGADLMSQPNNQSGSSGSWNPSSTPSGFGNSNAFGGLGSIPSSYPNSDSGGIGGVNSFPAVHSSFPAASGTTSIPNFGATQLSSSLSATPANNLFGGSITTPSTMTFCVPIIAQSTTNSSNLPITSPFPSLGNGGSFGGFNAAATTLNSNFGMTSFPANNNIDSNGFGGAFANNNSWNNTGNLNFSDQRKSNAATNQYNSSMSTSRESDSRPSVSKKPTDLSQNYEDIDQSSTSSGGKGPTGPSWELFFYRLKCLSNVQEFLRQLLIDDELFEVADLYVSTRVKGDSHHEDEMPNTDEGDDTYEAANQDIVYKLQLLRGWKRYEESGDCVEELMAGFEDIFGIAMEDVQHIPDTLQDQKLALEKIFTEVAYNFIPELILSADFGTYFETHLVQMKAHNRFLRIDSKSWIGKFQKTVKNMKYGFHLFPFGGGRPYANNYMRELFGPMCDAPSPKEYLDISTDAETTKALDTCIKTGKNQAFSIYCRQLKASRVPSVMSINHMQSVKHEGKILYSLVFYQDLSDSADAEYKKRIINYMVKALPSTEKK